MELDVPGVPGLKLHSGPAAIGAPPFEGAAPIRPGGYPTDTVATDAIFRLMK